MEGVAALVVVGSRARRGPDPLSSEPSSQQHHQEKDLMDSQRKKERKRESKKERKQAMIRADSLTQHLLAWFYYLYNFGAATTACGLAGGRVLSLSRAMPL